MNGWSMERWKVTHDSIRMQVEERGSTWEVGWVTSYLLLSIMECASPLVIYSLSYIHLWLVFTFPLLTVSCYSYLSLCCSGYILYWCHDHVTCTLEYVIHHGCRWCWLYILTQVMKVLGYTSGEDDYHRLQREEMTWAMSIDEWRLWE